MKTLRAILKQARAKKAQSETTYNVKKVRIVLPLPTSTLILCIKNATPYSTITLKIPS